MRCGKKLLERDGLHGNIFVWKTSLLATEWIIYYQTKYFSTLSNILSFSQTVILSVVLSVSKTVYIHWNEYTGLWIRTDFLCGRCLLELRHTEKINVEKYTVTYNDTRIHLHTDVGPSQCVSHNIHKHL